MKYPRVWICLAIALCIIPPSVILIYYGVYIEKSPFSFSLKDISNNANNWSAFGSLLSGAFTLSGATATIATLLYAIHQNKKLAIEAQKRADQDELVARDNKVFMAYQVSRVNFEKYKIHYGMFNDLLDQLERDSHGEKTFSSRSALYKKVFLIMTLSLVVQVSKMTARTAAVLTLYRPLLKN
jgi:hypothetical protein